MRVSLFLLIFHCFFTCRGFMFHSLTEMSSVKKRSPIWQYFDLDCDDNMYATCILCKVNISRGGEGKKADT